MSFTLQITVLSFIPHTEQYRTDHVDDLPHEPVDCFEPGFVGIVPLRTFLSQPP